MGAAARLALCLPLLMLHTPSNTRAQVRDPWQDEAASTPPPPPGLPPPPTVASIALSMRSRPIQDSRCYLMNGGAVESFFISEDTPVGSIIGTLSVNGDPRESQGDVSLRVQEAGAAVGLVRGSKNITLLRQLDREERDGPSNVYVNVRCDRRRTTDPSFVIPVSVRVWDVNDNAPAWTGAPYRVRVSELAAPGTRVLAPRALDADQPGPHATLHYSVPPGPHSDLVKFAHELESVLVVGSPLDYESLRNFTVTLRAADGGSPPLHADAELFVEVLDADDQNPVFSHEHYTAILPDDAQKDSILETSPGPVSAADGDAGIRAPLAYSATGDGRQLVRVHRDTGQLAVTDRLLAITQPVTVVIKATQVDNADRYALATLSVSRRSPPRAASVGGVRFASKAFHCRVSEAAAPGALVATLHTEPPSHANPLQFFVSDRSFLDKFAINGAGEVVLRRALDFEAHDAYAYQVMVTDGVANDTASLNITVLNVNEWEPRFRYPLYEFRVEPTEGDTEGDAAGEGAAGGTARGDRTGLLPVGKLDVFDGDKADSVTLSLTGPDAGMLYINASGEMFLRAEALAALNGTELRVRAAARDSGDPPRQTSVPVVVHVSPKLLRSSGSSSTPLLAAGAAAAALLLATLLCAALLLLRRRRRSKPSPAPACKPYSPPSSAPRPASPPTPSPPRAASPPAAATGSLQSVSAGASTILANSSSSLDLRDSLPTTGPANGGGLRGSRGKVAPMPPGAGGPSLMSDHLAGGAGGGGGRSGVAWPSSTIPARVKKLSWDDAAPHERKDSVVEANNTAQRDHMNLTVYF